MFFLHILLDVGGLTKAGRARLWRLTRKGEKFLATDAISQVLFLLSTWWYRVNWLVAYSYTGMGNSLPPRFAERTLASLRSLPVKKRIAFAGFADELISRTGLTWSVPDIARMALHGAIRRMVIGILADFGAVTLNYRKKPLGRGTIRELVAFRITMFGDFLLKALTQSSEPVDLRGFGNASGSAA
jgi:hypothetical protein